MYAFLDKTEQILNKLSKFVKTKSEQENGKQ